MKNAFVLIFLFSVSLCFSQNYDKAWAPLEKRIVAGESFSDKELNAFITKYEKDLASHPIDKSMLYDYLGSNAFHAQKYNEAISYFNTAIDLTKIANDTMYRAFYIYDLACLYNHIGYYSEAEPLFIKSLPSLAANYGASSLQYSLRFKVLAEMYVETGNYYYAKSMNDALLNYFKTLYGEKNIYYLVCLNNDARINQGTGNYEKALEIFDKLVETHASLVPMDSAGYMTTLNNSAEVYRVTGNYEKALSLFNTALEFSKKFPNHDKLTLATIYNGFGLCYGAMGDSKQSEINYDRSIAIYKDLKVEYSPEYTNPLNNKANLYRSLGRYKQAMDLLSEVIAVRKNSIGTHHQFYANAVNNVGLIYSDQGMYAEALPYLEEAKTIYKEVLGEDHQFYANCLNNLAITYSHLKRYKEAEELQEKAISIMKKAVGESHERYAYYLTGGVHLYDVLGKYDKAIANIEQANEIIKKKFGEKHNAYLDGLYNLAYFNYKLKNYKKAELLYIKALNGYKEQFDKFFESMSEGEQLSFYSIIGERFEGFNSFVFNYTQLFPKEDHRELIDLCFNYQLFLKSILLNNNINTRREILNSKDTSLVNTYNKWLGAKQQLSSSFRDLDTEGNYWNVAELEVYADKLEASLKTRTALFASQSSITYNDLQKKLGPNEAAINIIRAQKTINDSTSDVEYGAFILKNNSAPVLVQIARSKAFETDYVKYYSEQMENKKEDKLSYNRFWKQIASHLTGITKVYLSPDGIYNQINLFTLSNPVSNKYVLDEMAISILPNLTYILNESKTNTNKSAELFGFPDYEYDFSKKESKPLVVSAMLAMNRFGFSELPPLPGTKTEVENISASLQNNKWQIHSYTKEQASEAQLKKVNSPKVLHIATHGFFLKNVENYEDESTLGFSTSKLKQNPLLRSGIMMAGASVVARDTINTGFDQDGIFTAYEASLLNLSNTDLVVLSACETGLGVSINNQGVFGLQRAFYTAGAKNLIMSLWVVDDDATQILMSAFYKEWSADPARETISKAFKKAQLEVRKKYPHPYYWGAFTLLGN